MDIRLKRVYEPRTTDDGTRVLVDRVWPRGLSKEDARADVWMKEIAPSSELRKWFNHDPKKWRTFKSRYFAELKKNEATIRELLQIAEDKRVTLLFSARDEGHNQAVALKEYLGTHLNG